MLTCKEASYLASKKLDSKLTRLERLGFWLHIALCRLCRRYARDVKRVHAMMQNAGKSGGSMLPDSVKLSKQSRERMTQAIKKALHPPE